MKNILILLLLAALICNGCKDEATPPEPLPEGYQQDIPWPSLAESAWPMFKGNPQGNYRSKYLGPQAGAIEWINNDLKTTGGLVVDRNNGLYAAAWEPAGIFKIDLLSGKTLWHFDSLFTRAFDVDPTPTILSDGTIVATNGLKGSVLALSPDGKLKWTYDTGESLYSLGMGVSRSGLILFIDDSRTLHALDTNGNLVWKIKNESFSFTPHSTMSFSPDGEIIYFPGKLNGLIAFDLTRQQVIWSFSKALSHNFPLVDSDGNVYVLGSENPVLYCLNPDGTVKWMYNHSNSIFQTTTSLSMNKNGDIYFACNDSLYCVDYKGNLKFKNGNGTDWPILIDGNDDLYLVQGKNSSIDALKLNKQGEIIWRIENIIPSPAGFSILTNNGQWIIANWQYQKYIVAIK